MICCHPASFVIRSRRAPSNISISYEVSILRRSRQCYSEGVGASLYPGLDYQNAFFMFRETEIAHGEYDVRKCSAGMA